MKKILVFGGTTEGRLTAQFLAENEIACDVCVATEYGEEVLAESEFVHVKTGRLSESAMKELLAKEDYAAVIDATHPFATAVSQNIRQCMAENVACLPLFRFERKINQTEDAFCTYFASAAECAESLEATTGTILLTTGSKDLPLFCRSEEVKQRLIVRVLPAVESVRLCHEAGLEGRQIIAMQGPFSVAMNETQIEDFHVSVLVTKESGKTGGEDAKIAACRKKGIKCFIIRKPAVEPESDVPKNYAIVNSIQELASALESLFMRKIKAVCSLSITLAGIGMGSPENTTVEVQNALLKADYVFGASRMLENISAGGKKYPYYLAKDIVPVLRQIQAEEVGERRIVVLFSGDTGFFSGAENLRTVLKDSGFSEVCVLPGISSLSYLAAKLNISWQNVRIISTHGVAQENWLADLSSAVCSGAVVFFITSGAEDVQNIARRLLAIKKKNPAICDYIVQLGYQLSYADEKLYSLSLESCLEITQKGLYSGFLIPKHPEPNSTEAKGKAD